MDSDPVGRNDRDEFDYSDLKPVYRPVRVGDKRYLVGEATAAAAAEYKNAKMRMAKYDRDGNLSGLDGGGDLELIVVGACVVKTGPDGVTPFPGSDGKPVPVGRKVIEGFPPALVTKLFNWIKTSSLVDADDTPDNLQKQIDVLARRRDELLGKSGAGGDTTTSSSPPPTGSD